MQKSKRKLSAGDSLVVPAGQRDRGSSLIEILVSMVILSTGIIAVLAALGTTIHASSPSSLATR